MGEGLGKCPPLPGGPEAVPSAPGAHHRQGLSVPKALPLSSLSPFLPIFRPPYLSSPVRFSAVGSWAGMLLLGKLFLSRVGG